MSRLTFYFLITLFLILGAGNGLSARQTQMPAGSADVRGAWLARQVEDRDTAKDVRMSIRMRLYDRQNRVRERTLTMMSLRGGPGRPTPADRTLIRITHPADISGTGFLVWEQPEAEDERFLFLPSLGRVRRIAGAEAQESFVGSDFSYEDIGGREFDDYQYVLVNDAASWTASDGASHPAYVLESRRRDASSRFPRVVSTVRRDNYVVVHAEIFNRRDERQKTFDVRKLERISGYWTATDLVMSDAAQRTRTELVAADVAYDTGLSADDFSRRALERTLSAR